MRIASEALLLFLGCATGACHAEDYAAWKNVSRDGSWTLAAESAVEATSRGLLQLNELFKCV
jgi:hypothetical protein